MRDNSINIMKGFAIIGAVVGYCGFSSWTEVFVNQWHFAVFFFMVEGVIGIGYE